MAIRSFHDLEVYKLAHQFAMKVFDITKKFPAEEKYSLIDQVRRSSRSVAVNIVEGWGKRLYVNNFKRHLVDANGSLEESKSWLIFAKDCNYITDFDYKELFKEAEVIGSKLWKLHDNWKDFNL